ncbi:hypothetical protein ABH922_002818 [Rhodococcus sp. 27YEA15]|uniref:DUF2510 domain-containing protein n=1 Tax=Rhodococcus sp. 27YEA15 TaxID=3156259 RepID=UPI003C7E26B2
MTATRYSGNGTTVIFNPDEQTLTFEHSGILNAKAKKQASPWVIPLGAIESIEWRETKGFKSSEFRAILRSRAGFDDNKMDDFNFVNGADKITDFAHAVESALADAQPIDDFTPGTLTPTAGPPKRGWMEALADQAVLGEFEGIKLKPGSIHFKMSKHPVAGARATVEVGGTQRRTTATRMVVGSVVTLGVGTAIGAMAKKKTNNIYLTIDLEDGQVIMVEAKSKQESNARKFAAAVNQASAVASKRATHSEPESAQAPVPEFVESIREDVTAVSAPPPPPPSVPAGWYPDPSGNPMQRYWDGGQWTDHTAPLVSPPE